MASLRGSDRSRARLMCPGQIRGGQIKIKSPAGQKCMYHGQLFWPVGDYFSPRAKICVPRAIILARGQKYVSHGQLFWPAGDYFGPRAGRKMTKPTPGTLPTPCPAHDDALPIP